MDRGKPRGGFEIVAGSRAIASGAHPRPSSRNGRAGAKDKRSGAELTNPGECFQKREFSGSHLVLLVDGGLDRLDDSLGGGVSHRVGDLKGKTVEQGRDENVSARFEGVRGWGDFELAPIACEAANYV